MSGYKISESFAQRLKTTVLRVDAMPLLSGDGRIPVRNDERLIGSDSNYIRLCKTTSAWNKGTVATLELYEEGTPPSEGKKSPADTLTNCVNKFANVATDKWVIVAKAPNGYWYLIAAEC